VNSLLRDDEEAGMNLVQRIRNEFSLAEGNYAFPVKAYQKTLLVLLGKQLVCNGE